ncbi:MAG: formyltetrahydrofolate deformylase [Chlamydiota bacterium]
MEQQKFILTLSCIDRLGVVAEVSTFLARHSGFILEMAQFGDLSTGHFFMRCVFEFHKKPLTISQFSEQFKPIANELGLIWKISNSLEKPRVLLLVSTQGHCLNDLLHRSKSSSLQIQIAAVASNHEDLREVVDWYKIPFHFFPITPDKKEEQEAKIAALVDTLNIDLIVLARYMQILSPKLTQKLSGKAINIHHSFLPSFKGAKPYHQAFNHGVKLIGATAHYVSDILDEGPIIEQEVLRVDHTHTPQQLVELGRDIECQVLARAVKYHAEQRVFLNGNKTVVFK